MQINAQMETERKEKENGMHEIATFIRSNWRRSAQRWNGMLSGHHPYNHTHIHQMYINDFGTDAVHMVN